MACAIAPKAAGRELLVAGVTQIANRKSQIVNPKNQTNHKSQIPHKFKTPNSKGINQGHVWGGELAVWDLRFWICLGFGILDWGFWSRESKNPGKHAIFQGFQGCDSGLSKVEAPGHRTRLTTHSTNLIATDLQSRRYDIYPDNSLFAVSSRSRIQSRIQRLPAGYTAPRVVASPPLHHDEPR